MRIIKICLIFYIISIGILGSYVLHLQQTEFKFQGQVEENCLDLQRIQQINNKIYPLINELIVQIILIIILMNLYSECPFWAAEFICKNRKCSVCECELSEIPESWLLSSNETQVTQSSDQIFWGTERKIDSQLNFNQYIKVWNVEDLKNDDGVYVDLQVNPESYTGYQGQKIWSEIYKENCFKGNNWDLLCKEERGLNKMISGLHTSITTQLEVKHVAVFPDRVKNLLFLYTILLRSFNLAQNAIENLHIDSNNSSEDIRARQLINELYKQTIEECQKPFDENEFFRDAKNVLLFQSNHYKDTMLDYQKFIHNISMIMDCVECQKCKVHGKLQAYGLGTALKILFKFMKNENYEYLQRNEVVAFINTIGKVSSSIYKISQMFDAQHQKWNNIFYFSLLGGALIIFFLHLLFKTVSKYKKQKKL